MSLYIQRDETLRSAVEILESASESERKRMLYLLRLEKARPLARKLDKVKSKVKKSDKQIAETIHRIRKGYGRK